MMDGIIKSDGTSRLMQAELPATYEEFRAKCLTGDQPLDVLFNALGWSQLPTFLNKTNLLQDPTAALFGFGADAVPNTVFNWLGQYNTHWWSVLHGQASTEYVENKSVFNTLSSGDYIAITDGSASQTLQYSKSVTVNQETGEITLDNPQSMTVKGGSAANASSIAEEYLKPIVDLAPVYITNLYGSPNTIYFVPSGVTYSSRYTSRSTETFSCALSVSSKLVLNGSSTCANPVYTVSATIVNIPAGETTHVHSADRNAYPDSGTIDGLTYQYLGIPFQNAVTAPKIATGSYTGTGKSGSSNKNKLTFDFKPKFVIILGAKYFSNMPAHYFGLAVLAQGLTGGFGSFGYSYTDKLSESFNAYGVVVSWSGNTVSWYNYSNANAQLNASGATYNYIAIG